MSQWCCFPHALMICCLTSSWGQMVNSLVTCCYCMSHTEVWPTCSSGLIWSWAGGTSWRQTTTTGRTLSSWMTAGLRAWSAWIRPHRLWVLKTPTSCPELTEFCQKPGFRSESLISFWSFLLFYLNRTSQWRLCMMCCQPNQCWIRWAFYDCRDL